LHNYADYGWLRGFNVVPSWGARIEEAWWKYDPRLFRNEISLARQVHANCIRLWIEFTAWMADPGGVSAAFMDAVAAIDEQGMKTEPCLFNRWHDRQGWDYGGTYVEDLHRNWSPKLDYVRSIVGPLAGDHRILMWDLCNEPQTHSLDDAIAAREIIWLTEVANTVRESGAQQPITIGTYQPGENMRIFAPLCDVLCCHPYAHSPQQMVEMRAKCEAVQRDFGKPMHCNECIPGAADDSVRAYTARFSIESLVEAGWGWIGWGMRQGKAVSTRLDRMDTNGIDQKGFHAWFREDGELREGLDFLREPPIRRAPWESRPSVPEAGE
jgi:hypothetical protein